MRKSRTQVRAEANAHHRHISKLVYVSAGIEALPVREQALIRDTVETYIDFEAEIDLYGKRDCGSLNRQPAKIFWSIDYYAKGDPTNPLPYSEAETLRVVTIMLDEELPS